MMLFNHILDLDLRFHLMRRTGEISKICDRGTDAMQVILQADTLCCWVLDLVPEDGNEGSQPPLAY